MRIALTVAGSDSSAGAGIQADLKTFAAFRLYGVSAVTAVTAQSTCGVAEAVALSAEMVHRQIEELARDVDIAAVKTGMLATADIVRVVADTLAAFPHLNLVVDPVITATSGRTLLEPEGVLSLTTRLLPIAAVVTPNSTEASALSGIRVDSQAAAREAAKRISDFGVEAVVITGGDSSGPDAIDLLFHQAAFTEFSAPRTVVDSIHGTGCAFASAVASGLALGDDIPTSVDRAKRYVSGAITHSFQLGRGARALNHFWSTGLYS